MLLRIGDKMKVAYATNLVLVFWLLVATPY